MAERDDQLMKELENMSPEQAKKTIIDSLHPNCKTIGGDFFNCVEGEVNKLSGIKNISYEEIEKQMNTKFVPSCMSKYNLESCLQNNSNI